VRTEEEEEVWQVQGSKGRIPRGINPEILPEKKELFFPTKKRVSFPRAKLFSEMKCLPGRVETPQIEPASPLRSSRHLIRQDERIELPSESAATSCMSARESERAFRNDSTEARP